MAKDSCLARVSYGVAIGGAIGGAIGSIYGTYESIRYKLEVLCEALLGFEVCCCSRSLRPTELPTIFDGIVIIQMWVLLLAGLVVAAALDVWDEAYKMLCWLS
ncbi:hypothetical protein Droror1_Dr00023366 [Drosera rotundifolia]